MISQPSEFVQRLSLFAGIIAMPLGWQVIVYLSDVEPELGVVPTFIAGLAVPIGAWGLVQGISRLILRRRAVR